MGRLFRQDTARLELAIEVTDVLGKLLATNHLGIRHLGPRKRRKPQNPKTVRASSVIPLVIPIEIETRNPPWDSRPDLPENEVSP